RPPGPREEGGRAEQVARRRRRAVDLPLPARSGTPRGEPLTKASELPATGVSVPRPPVRSSMSQSFGAGYYPPERAPARPETHPSAVPALVPGILSLALCGLFAGIPAIFRGRRAANDIRYYPSRYTGLAVASGGFWTGLVGTILSAIFIGLFVT